MKVVVVGGGITGLAAAWELTRSAPGVEVVVLESSGRAGGKLLTSRFAGRPVDEGADAFLARTPAAIVLCDELGVGHQLVAPGTGVAWVWVDGALRPLPDGHVLGVPTDLDALARSGILTPAGLARAAADLDLVADEVPADESIGALVRRRLGAEVLERLVGPLVGGINGGDADRLSVRAVTPQLAAAAGAGPSLIAALREQRRAAPAGSPVFLTLPGGLGTLVDALVDAIGGTADIRFGTPAEGLAARAGARWTVHTPSGPVDADGVVVTTPAFHAARLLHDTAGEAAGLLGGIEYASVALVALSFRDQDVPIALDGSGFLVPRDSGLTVTACSWFSSKWPHLTGDGTVVLRVAVGRHGDAGVVARPDDGLVALVRADLATTMGITAPPLATRISRWPDSFPQYAPGHLARVARIESALGRDAPGVTVAGAAFRGLGVPACIDQGRAAARRVLPVRR